MVKEPVCFTAALLVVCLGLMQDLEARTGEHSTSEVLDVSQTFSNPLDLTKNTLNKGDCTDQTSGLRLKAPCQIVTK